MNNENLRPFTTRKQAKLFGAIGGSRKTIAKKRALIITNMRRRKCVNCNYLDCCFVAQSVLSRRENIKNYEKTKDILPTLESKCQLPLWTLNALSYINTCEDLHEIEKFFFSRMVVGLDNFTKQYSFSKLLFKSLLKNRVNVDLIKSQQDIRYQLSWKPLEEKVIVVENGTKDNRDKLQSRKTPKTISST